MLCRHIKIYLEIHNRRDTIIPWMSCPASSRTSAGHICVFLWHLIVPGSGYMFYRHVIVGGSHGYGSQGHVIFMYVCIRFMFFMKFTSLWRCGHLSICMCGHIKMYLEIPNRRDTIMPWISCPASSRTSAGHICFSWRLTSNVWTHFMVSLTYVVHWVPLTMIMLMHKKCL